MNNEIKSTTHSKYRCEYHIEFVSKYKRVKKEYRRDIKKAV